MLTALWGNRRVAAEFVGLMLALLAAWWFFIHNPRVIRQLETEKTAALQQVKIAQDAINLLISIQQSHSAIDNRSNENVDKIRNGRKPGRDGVFIAGGVLPPVYQDYSADRTTAVNGGGPVLP